ncbi:epidermis-specific secreted glycoprotein EP1-like [Carex rostrata]
MAFTYSLVAFVALLQCFSFSVNSQPENYPTTIAPSTWTNSPDHQLDFTFNDSQTVHSILFRLNANHGMSFVTGFYCFPPYGLTLRDSDGSLVWSTSRLNQSVAGINITEAGNLVLFDINNSTIWQSFDHPTDCIVMGQTLARGMRLIANSSSTDLAESQLYLTILADGLFAFVNLDSPVVYYSIVYITSNDNVQVERSIKFMNGSLTMFSTLSNTNKGTIILTFPPAKSIQYMRLESDGHLRLYDFDEFQWKMVVDVFNMGNDFDSKLDNCDYPTVCGHYGICNNRHCICPGTSGNYFVPVDEWRPELGCSAVTNITCQDVNNHHLLGLNNVSYFYSADNPFLGKYSVDSVASNITEEEPCKKAGLRDCTCKAVLFQYYNSDSTGKCLTLLFIPLRIINLRTNLTLLHI